MPKDYFTKKSEEEDTRARSYYKLQQIDKVSQMIRLGSYVLDLGSFPGGWMQYCLEKIGSKGFVFGVDVDEIEPFDEYKNYKFFYGDVFSEEAWKEIAEYQFDVVFSDMAPKFSGIKDIDYLRTYELCKRAFYLAKKVLKPRGFFLCKMFRGEEFEKLKKELEKSFIKVKMIKPDASKATSKEAYLLGIGFRG
ncbi:RlmE family RNA methyltransferase [Candidatus Woesearchaeota archaeon]|nr:RlmE family RNA methyltransferase [Candidatus Woesearchaeota archaeon]